MKKGGFKKNDPAVGKRAKPQKTDEVMRAYEAGTMNRAQKRLLKALLKKQKGTK
jgi:hypothetical protein